MDGIACSFIIVHLHVIKTKQKSILAKLNKIKDKFI